MLGGTPRTNLEIISKTRMVCFLTKKSRLHSLNASFKWISDAPNFRFSSLNLHFSLVLTARYSSDISRVRFLQRRAPNYLKPVLRPLEIYETLVHSLSGLESTVTFRNSRTVKLTKYSVATDGDFSRNVQVLSNVFKIELSLFVGSSVSNLQMKTIS